MRAIKLSALAIAVMAIVALHAKETPFSSGRYISPVDFKIYLSGNFGEIRDNHFHSGIDIKTQGVTGKAIRAVADGYVSRIGVSPYGYGNAVYIHHPDGMTSVYAHLETFNEKIGEFVRDAQYRQRSFAVSLYPTSRELPVKQGDIIAYSGNSGSSGGPHLHFEMREQASQKPVNPVTYGYVEGIDDNIAPVFMKLYIYETDDDDMVHTYDTYNIVKAGNGQYRIEGDKTVKCSSLLYTCMDIEVVDHKNNSGNTMGINKMDMSVDGKSVFGFETDKFSFDETRYANAFVNYADNKKTRNTVIRTYVLPNNKLSIYTPDTIYGDDIQFKQSKRDSTFSKNFEITIEDDNGNKSALAFTARYTPAMPLLSAPYSEHLIWDEEFTPLLAHEHFNVNIPAGASYMSRRITAALSDGSRPKGSLSILGKVNEIYTHNATPLHIPMTIGIKADSIPERIRGKLCIARLSAKGAPVYEGGKFISDSVMEVSTRNFGEFYVTCDTVPPKIVPSFANDTDMSERQTLKVEISDDFSGIAKWEVAIDGEWALFDYDPKTKSLTHHLKYARYEKGKTHTMVVTVEDNKGNKSSATRRFIY